MPDRKENVLKDRIGGDVERQIPETEPEPCNHSKGVGQYTGLGYDDVGGDEVNSPEPEGQDPNDEGVQEEGAEGECEECAETSDVDNVATADTVEIYLPAHLIGDVDIQNTAQNKDATVEITVIAKDGIKTKMTGTRVGNRLEIKRSIFDPTGSYTDEEWAALKIQLENYNRKLGGARCVKHGEFTSRGKHAIMPEDIKDIVISPVQCENLSKAYNGTIAIELDDGATIEIAWINFDHILGPDIVIHCAKGEISVTGFHHDYLGRAKKSDKFKFEIIKMGEHGVYIAKWSYGNAEPKTSTFFPDEWTRSKVVEKILEALKNKK